MASCAIANGHHQPSYVDDEIAALTLQLEEIDLISSEDKGKYHSGSLPDTQIPFVSLHAEIQAHIAYLNDLKLAHSIAYAVDTDAQAIADAMRGEEEAREDRRRALQMSGQDPELEDPPPQYSEVDAISSSAVGKEEMERLARLLYEDYNMGFEEEEENEAGPSVPYAERQAKALGILASSEALECCSCRDHFGLNSVVRLDCMDLYCIDCLKGLFMQSIKDFSLFPPRCCGKHIPLALITKQLAVEELDDFHLAEAEFESRDKTYCSNAECGRFIPPTRIRADRGECDRCGADTCTLCKNAFHTNDCPADPALQATLDLAAHQGWRRCFACRALVEISTGCNHMTCKCGAQFCYICGEPWRSCRCSFWDENNLLQRAEEVVERNAMGPLPQHERRRRVNEMRDELREDHDCEQGHSRRFERVNNYTRRGMECELCGARHWKYLLECRRCHIAVCEVCRRNRV